MKTAMKKSKLVSMILLASLSSVTFSQETENSLEKNDATYWGLGIGSVLGGVIAGPPGIAIGAGLGGAFGWGQDQHEELEKTQEALSKQEALFSKKESILNGQAEQLKVASQRLGELKRNQHHQNEELTRLRSELTQQTQALAKSDLASVLEAYTQEVYFEKGKSSVPDYADERISNLAEFLNRYPDLQVSLIGYTDKSGPASFNDALAQARAEGVRNALHAQGVALERMLIQSQGESMAKVSEGDKGNAILDRRVAIELNQIVFEELHSNQEEQVMPVDDIGETTLAELVK